MIDWLLDTLRHSDCDDAKRIAENLELDFPTLQSSHDKAAIHGNNVQSLVEEQIRKEILKRAEDWKNDSISTDDIIKDLENLSYQLFSSRSKTAHFRLPQNQNNQVSSTAHSITADSSITHSPNEFYSLSYTRYLPAANFYRHYLYDPETDSEVRSDQTEVIKDKIEAWFRGVLPLIDEKELTQYWLGVPDEAVEKGVPPYPIWITPAEQAPHQLEEMEDLPEHERTWKVVQKLALPGYATASERKSKLGIIAVRFTLKEDWSIYKPTILDAMGKPCYFFPAPTQEVYGLTRELTPTLNQTTDLEGHQELICQSFQVALKEKGQVHIEKVGFFQEEE